MADINATDISRQPQRPIIGGEWFDYWDFRIVFHVLTENDDEANISDEAIDAVAAKAGRIIGYMEKAHSRKQRLYPR